ncbi:MAG: FG-GAP-like repeat-containing protein [Candidatus Eiseniibacteriota bacterium]
MPRTLDPHLAGRPAPSRRRPRWCRTLLRELLTVAGCGLLGLGLAAGARAAFIDVTPAGMSGGGGSGSAWGDADGDGDLDLYLTRLGANRLFRNDGDDVFVDIAAGTVLADSASGHGVAWGDIDGDGDLDLYISNESGGPNRLLRNDGAAGFTDATSGPLGDADPSFASIWGDADNDGDIDLYLGKWGHPNRYLRNEGGGVFVDATQGPLAGALASDLAAWGDADADGDLDLYVAVYLGANRLLRNDGDGQFVDATTGPLGDTGPTEGMEWGDADGDGDLDLYFASEDAPGTLLRNDGGLAFRDVTAGPLGATTSYDVAWGDHDLDGDLDLLVTSARLLRNDGVAGFTDVTASEMPGAQGATCARWGDHDGDGDLDVFMAGGVNQLFRNDRGGGAHWLAIDLAGSCANSSGIGARVRVVTGGGMPVAQVREISGGSGFCSQSTMRAHFGLGTAATVDSVTVRWPSGATRTWTGLPVDARLELREPILVPVCRPTLAAAVAAAVDGDWVQLAPGVHAGPGNREVTIDGVSLEIRSTQGAAVTRLDGEGLGRLVAVRGDGATMTEVGITGLTLSGGAAVDGGAMRVESATLRLEDCVVAGSVADTRGGAILATGEAVLTVLGSTLDRNAAPSGGGIALADGASALVERTIVSFSVDGEAVAVEPTGSAWLACTDLFGNAGGDWVGPVAGQLAERDNLTADPLYCDAAAGDWTLAVDSPCAPGQAPGACGRIGALPVGCGTVGLADGAGSPARAAWRCVPNPLRTGMTLRAIGPRPARWLEVYDVRGRLVARSAGPASTPIWPGAGAAWSARGADGPLAAGVYLVRAGGAGWSASMKVVVVH